MRLKTTVLMIVFVLLVATGVRGAFLRDLPATLIQKDGTVLHCLVTGDEYYHRVHDSAGYTIVIDPATGYNVYAKLVGDELVPSTAIVGRDDPSVLGIVPGLRPGRAVLEERVAAYRDEHAERSAPPSGTVNFVCIFVRFSDQTEFEDERHLYDSIFNLTGANAVSLHSYYLESSYQMLDLTTSFYPPAALDTNSSFQTIYPRDYYRPAYGDVNPLGYDETSNWAKKERENVLVAAVVEAAQASIPPDLDVDADNNGYVDNVVIVFRGAADVWGEIIWPHRWDLSHYDAYINGAQVWDYNVQVQIGIAAPVLCHETGHSLGLPDLYHYYDTLTPVGLWDIMANETNPPQHTGAWHKGRYLGWTGYPLPAIEQGGYYSLNPLTSQNGIAYTINTDTTRPTMYLLQYRKQVGLFESALPTSGLLIQRIEPVLTPDGNANGPPDEVYVFRPGGIWNADSLASAPFSIDYGKVCINNDTDPAPFIFGAIPGDVFIADIGPCGDQLTFYATRFYHELDALVVDGDEGPLMSNPTTRAPYWATGGGFLVPDPQTLTILNGTTVFFDAGAKMLGFGRIQSYTGSQETRLASLYRYRTGIVGKGGLLIQNGGGVKMY